MFYHHSKPIQRDEVCVSSTIETVGCNIFRLFIVTTPTLSSMEIAGIICNGDVLRYILIFTTIFHKE